MSNTSDGFKNNRVGPVIRAGDIAQAAIDAAEIDNEGKEVFVQDRHAYIRLETDHEFVLKRETMEEMLGRPFETKEIEINLGSFAGKIDINPDQIRFYFDKKL